MHLYSTILPLLPLLFSSTSSAAGVSYAGVNIAGFDFGVGIDGSYINYATPPGSAGQTQMQHFVQQDKFNMFRLPVAWQYLQTTPGGTLNPTNLQAYDQLVTACLNTGARCIIDLHNYARWNNTIIGQGGPTNAQFAAFWGAMAKHYASHPTIVFGIMNEPHDLPSLSTWVTTVQAAVTAIRNNGATSQMILLPGTNWLSVGSLAGTNGPALASIRNPGGGYKNLILDGHTYFDSDGSGGHTNCVTDHISDAFQPAATWLKNNGRQMILSEFGGGGSDSSCLQYICNAMAFVAANPSQFLGWTAWSAGSFDYSYILNVLSGPTTDVPLMTQCMAGKFSGGVGLATTFKSRIRRAEDMISSSELVTVAKRAIGEVVGKVKAAWQW